MKSKIEMEMEERANEEYQRVAYDLPPQGRYHWHSAIGYLADWLYDHYRNKWKKGKFQTIAKRVVNHYCSSDTKESKRNEKRKEQRDRGWDRKKKLLGEPEAWRDWDQRKPKRLGTGSY